MPPCFAAVDAMDFRPRPLPPLLVDKCCPSFIRGFPSKELVHTMMRLLPPLYADGKIYEAVRFRNITTVKDGIFKDIPEETA